MEALTLSVDHACGKASVGLTSVNARWSTSVLVCLTAAQQTHKAHPQSVMGASVQHWEHAAAAALAVAAASQTHAQLHEHIVAVWLQLLHWFGDSRMHTAQPPADLVTQLHALLATLADAALAPVVQRAAALEAAHGLWCIFHPFLLQGVANTHLVDIHTPHVPWMQIPRCPHMQCLPALSLPPTPPTTEAAEAAAAVGAQQRLGRFANSMVARVRATTANLAMGNTTAPQLSTAPAHDSHTAHAGHAVRPGSADASAHLSSTLLSGQTLEAVGGMVSTHYQEPENKGVTSVTAPHGEGASKGCVDHGVCVCVFIIIACCVM